MTTLLLVLAFICLMIGWAEHTAVRCPKCNSRMVYGVGGYDKHTCLYCGHSQRKL